MSTEESPLVANQESKPGEGDIPMQSMSSQPSTPCSSLPPFSHIEVECGSEVGKLKVYIQYCDDPKAPSSPCHKRPEGHQGLYVMTMPDIGSTYHVVQRFYQHPAMEDFNKRTTWIHVIPPGQDLHDPDLPANYQFPSFQQLGESLVHVLDHLGVKYCLCFGEGAGANILSRFALKYPDRVAGLVLLHCIGSAASFLGSLRERYAASQLDTTVPASADNFFIMYHFGKQGENSPLPQVREAVHDFQEHLHKDLNPRNLKQYVNAHIKRSNIEDQFANIQAQVMFVVGENAYHAVPSRMFYESVMEKLTDKRRIEWMEMSGVADVLDAAPNKLAESLLLFVQGLGLLSSVTGRSRSTSVRMGRSASMQEADQPAGHYKRNLQRNQTGDSSDAAEQPADGSNGN